MGSRGFTLRRGQMHHTFTESVSLGIMCNLMVCPALWMSYCGRSLCDKIVAMILPITLFVASGFEHCIANLFVIPFAIAIRHFAPPPSGNWRTVAQTIFRL